MGTNRWWRGGLAVAVAVAGGWAWLADVRAPGPLGLEQQGASICMQGTDGAIATGVLRGPSGPATTLTRVTLGSGSGLAVDDAVLAHPGPDGVRVGTASWPLPDDPWRAEPAIGTPIRPGESVDLVLHVVRAGSDGGSAGPVRVEYVQGAERHVETTGFHVALRDHC